MLFSQHASTCTRRLEDVQVFLPSRGILAEVVGINLATFSENTVKLRSIVIPGSS